jgi:very-short-patch-repair endonuclease
LEAVLAGGRLSCVTACESYGLWAGTDRRTHLILPPNGHAPPSGVVRHWRRCEPNDELWRVSLADCLRSVARCADRETAVAVFDTALTTGLVTRVRLHEIIEDQPRAARSRVELARAGSDSGVESIVRQRLERAGRRVEQQVYVRGVGRVDMRVDGELYLEIDGFAFHSDRDAFERDRRRDAVLEVRGDRRLRVTARQVLREWGAVESIINAALPSARSQPTHSNAGTIPALAAVLLTDGAAASARRTQEET